MRCVEARLGVLALRRGVIDEAVGQHHRPDLQSVVEHALGREILQHVAGEAADRAFLDGDEHLVLAREPKEQLGIEGLGEAGISDGGRKSKRGKLVSRFEAFSKPRAEREQRYFGALAQHAPLADFEGDAFRRPRHAHAFATGIAQRRRTVVNRGGGRHHVHEIGFVRRRHDDETGKAAEIGDVEGAGMGRAIGTDQPRAVHGKTHR